jgi:hypothetical protein
MNIIQEIEQYNIKHVFYSDPIKNNIINDSNFIRILYSNKYISLNGIALSFLLINPIIDKYFYKYKATFNTVDNALIIENIKDIEYNLLKLLNINRIPQYKIVEQIQNKSIIFFSNNFKKNANTFILKISGVWYNDIHYGLTYKFIQYNDIVC